MRTQKLTYEQKLRCKYLSVKRQKKQLATQLEICVDDSSITSDMLTSLRNRFLLKCSLLRAYKAVLSEVSSPRDWFAR